ncbi:chromate transporter [Lentibacillus sp. CBA3610]|uniref:chromate transporter n=1 Tax=Lentibacillus sp. CBA3610 TaxID=2518176 RepID=UPI0020D21818|nr:chromate transporter [Lentibacillus sp. CBA3610]
MADKNKIWTFIEILLTSTKLGLTSFGGPVAHLAYFKDEYIDRRKWLDDKTYADIIALCQFLPGPASSQVGISIGMMRGGLLGGLISWFGFTVPSVIVLVVFAMMYQTFSLADAGFIHSLKIVAAAVVLHALIGLGKKMTPDKSRLAIAVVAAAVMLYTRQHGCRFNHFSSRFIGTIFLKIKPNRTLKPFSSTISKNLAYV